jgi:hypothetical protein
MKRALPTLFVAAFLSVGCGLNTAGLGDPGHQAGATGNQRTDPGAPADAADASPAPDAQAADGAPMAVDGSVRACGATTCGAGAVCCAQDLGGGKIATSCAATCTGGGAVVCDLGGVACRDGDCSLSGKFPGLSVCD